MERLALSLGVLAVWVGLTILAGPPLTGEASPLDLMRDGLAWQVVLAGLFLVAVIASTRWEGLGLGAPRPWSSLWLVWPHGVFVAGFLVVAVASGADFGAVALLILVNSLLVGFSEELMFRGVLLSAVQRLAGVWPAIVVSSGLFGAVHVLNVFITGDLGGAALQAVAAAMSGLAFAAILIRTGSIWPAMLAHGLWDFGLFMIGHGVTPEGAPAAGEGGAGAGALVFVLPVFLYGLWLLRRVR